MRLCENIKVQELTPFAAKFNFIVEEYAASKGRLPPHKRKSRNVVYIATIEKVMNILYKLSVCLCVPYSTKF